MSPLSRHILLFLALLTLLPSQTPATEPQPGSIVFASRTWEGEYATDDIPGGVKITPVVGALYTVTADGQDLKKIVQLGNDTNAPSYSPDGKWIYFQSSATGHVQLYRCSPDGTSITCLTENTPLGPQWKQSYGAALSQDGTQLLYTVHDGESGRIALANSEGSKPRILFPDFGYTYMGSLSPLGNQVILSGPARGYRLLIAELPTGQPRELTPDHPDSYAPQFTPDGKVIVFVRRDGEIYRINADGTALQKLTTGNNYVEFRLSAKDHHGSTDGPQISPDGSRIAYVRNQEGVPNIFSMKIDGSEQTQVTFRKTPCGRPRWSPDGKRLAFVSFEGKYPQLFVVPSTGGEPQRLTDLPAAVYFLQWKP